MNIKRIFLLLSICAILLLAGCDLTSGGEDASADQVLTYVAETISAALSLTPPATNTFTPTATATSTATATFTPSPSLTSSATVAVVNNTGGNTTGGNAAGCDNASFVSDVTIPDGTQFAPGTAFTKTWRMQNSGSCTWTTAYSVYFVNGEAMSGQSPQVLNSESATGTSRDISINLVAPSTPGTHTGYWQLKNAAGVAFGDKFYVQIVVTGNAATPTGPTNTPTITPTGPTNTPDPSAAGKPDLKVTGVSYDPNPSRGKEYTIKITLENVGGGDAGAFLVEYWSDIGVASKKGWNISGMSANSSKTLEFTCECYDNSGNFTYKILADATGAIDEGDEGNNEWKKAIDVQ